MRIEWETLGFERVGCNAAAPQRFTATAEGVALVPRFDPECEGPFTVSMTVSISPRGIPRCVGLTITGDGESPVTGAVLRRVSVATLLRDVVERASLRIDFEHPGRLDPLPVELAAPARKPRPGARITDGELDRVASIYKQALADGDHPTQAVCMGYHGRKVIPRSTASNWIKLARKRGFLAPARQGKAGG